MRHSRRLHLFRAAALTAALALGAIGLAAPPSSAMVLPTTTTVATSGSPTLTDGEVTFTATVTLAGLNLNLGPVTPGGTVTFTVDGAARPPVPLSGCVVLLRACTASVTLPTPVSAGDTWAVSARYNGDFLAKPSTGQLTREQEFVDATVCQTEQTCDTFLDSSDGTAHARVVVDAEPAPPDETYRLLLAATGAPMSCTRPNTGSGFYLDTEGAAAEGLAKTFTYITMGPAAVAASSDVMRICWQADSPFTTRAGTPAPVVGTMYEGLLPGCDDGEGPPANAPCVEDSWYDPDWDSLGPRLQTTIITPPGDPRASR